MVWIQPLNFLWDQQMNKDTTITWDEVIELLSKIDIRKFRTEWDTINTAHFLLINKYAPFKKGDRVELSEPPIITDKVAWGWQGSKHFLVEGAKATVSEVEIRTNPMCIVYGLLFDDESYLDIKNNPVLIEKDRRHIYTFLETSLRKCK